MEKGFLEERLAKGLSLEAIGREVGKHPSAVSYWLKKHGLTAVGSSRFSPRGGVKRAFLETAVRDGLTLREMADLVGRDISTVRYWLKRYGLKATGGARRRGEGSEAAGGAAFRETLSPSRSNEVRARESRFLSLYEMSWG